MSNSAQIKGDAAKNNLENLLKRGVFEESFYEMETSAPFLGFRQGQVQNSFRTKKTEIFLESHIQNGNFRPVGLSDTTLKLADVDYSEKEIRIDPLAIAIRDSIQEGATEYAPYVIPDVIKTARIHKDVLNFNLMKKIAKTGPSFAFNAGNFKKEIIDIYHNQAKELGLNQSNTIFIFSRNIKTALESQRIPSTNVDYFAELETWFRSEGVAWAINSHEDDVIYVAERSLMTVYAGNDPQLYASGEVGFGITAAIEHQFQYSTDFYVKSKDDALLRYELTGLASLTRAAGAEKKTLEGFLEKEKSEDSQILKQKKQEKN